MFTKKLTASLLALTPLASCTLQLDFEGEKTKVKVVSYQGDVGLTGTGIGATLAVGDIDLDNTDANGVTTISDIIVAQELDVGSLASIPVRENPANAEDLRTHFITNEGKNLSGSTEDSSSRRYGISTLVKNLGGGIEQKGPELIVGSPSKTNGIAGNVVIFDGDTQNFSFGLVIGRLSGDSQELNFGQSIALGDADGATVGGNPDEFQVLAVGSPGDGAETGSVYLYRTFSNGQGDVAFCTDGIPAALKIDAATVAAALPASTAIGPSFGAQILIGEAGNLLGTLDDRAELIVTEPAANRLFIFSFDPSAATCDSLVIDSVNTLEIPLNDSPTSITLLDAGTNNAQIAVGFAAAQAGVGEIDLCTTDILVLPPTPSCTALPNPAPTYERLGAFSLAGYGNTMVSGDMNGDGSDDLLIGASASAVGGKTNAGAALMLFSDGAGSMITAAENVQVFADFTPEANARTGAAVAIIGDLSLDGLSEVVIGAPGANGGKGQALFYLDVTAPGFVPPP
jgi:FG-GAP repeat